MWTTPSPPISGSGIWLASRRPLLTDEPELGMSRTHLYKLLDSGEIPCDHVGRDRRIRVHDLLDFEARRMRDRRELAQRFATQRKTRAGAIDEVADLL